MRKATGSYRNLFIPSKSATLVSEFSVEDLPLSKTATLVPAFAVKDLPLETILIMMLYIGLGTLSACSETLYLYINRNISFLDNICTIHIYALLYRETFIKQYLIKCVLYLSINYI